MLSSVGAAIALAVIAVLGGWFARRRASARRQSTPSGGAALREQILSRTLFAGGPEEQSTNDLRCVVMDWGVGSGVATLAAFEDGTTSLYWSSGGGILGAGGRDAVRRIAATFRAEAALKRDLFRPATAFPLPLGGDVVFYLVSDDATLSSGSINAAQLASGEHPLASVGQAAQEVINEVRSASELPGNSMGP
ncbi:MAG: hypothetical protein M3Z54_03150 [Gemmatimonadota bacterium]|nr:hypothetical protein [Gemmatimonadota bacterium]